jgi:hypothetical protein
VGLRSDLVLDNRGLRPSILAAACCTRRGFAPGPEVLEDSVLQSRQQSAAPTRALPLDPTKGVASGLHNELSSLVIHFTYFELKTINLFDLNFNFCQNDVTNFKLSNFTPLGLNPNLILWAYFFYRFMVVGLSQWWHILSLLF